jgi:hypothetical protein
MHSYIGKALGQLYVCDHTAKKLSLQNEEAA